MVGRKAYSLSHTMDEQQLWIELPPINGEHPKRLLVFLHGAGSNPDAFAPVAIAWQLKFQSAAAFVIQAPIKSSLSVEGFLQRFDWLPNRLHEDAQTRADTHKADIVNAAITVMEMIKTIQQTNSLGMEETVIIGFSQGATIALEICRMEEQVADIYVSYAGQLSSAILANENPKARAIHLIHGTLDSVITADKSQRAFQHLAQRHHAVTLDLLEDGIHSIDQESVNVGTIRVMQTLFKGRLKKATTLTSGLDATPSTLLH
jgi:phospholipase/carboxylesterase